MPHRGQVEVTLSAAQCRAAARWLRSYRAPPPTWLREHSAEEHAAEIQIAGYLSERFAKAGRRKAKVDAVRWIDRELAAWFGALWSEHPIPPLVSEAQIACRLAAEPKRKGRPPIKRSPEEIQRLSFGENNSDERRRRRWLRRARRTQALSEWIERMSQRGETLLTSTERLPEILPD